MKVATTKLYNFCESVFTFLLIKQKSVGGLNILGNIIKGHLKCLRTCIYSKLHFQSVVILLAFK